MLKLELSNLPYENIIVEMNGHSAKLKVKAQRLGLATFQIDKMTTKQKLLNTTNGLKNGVGIVDSDNKTSIIYEKYGSYCIVNTDLTKWTPMDKEQNSIILPNDTKINIFHAIVSIMMFSKKRDVLNIKELKLADEDLYILLDYDNILHISVMNEELSKHIAMDNWFRRHM